MTQTNLSPQLTKPQVLALLDSHFGLTGQLSDLPSYADLNYLLLDNHGQKFVVKIANPHHSADELDFENLAMEKLSNDDIEVQVPKVLKTISGQQRVDISDTQNRSCMMRVISFLDGNLWAESDTQDLSFVSSLGKVLASVDKCLASLSHPASHRYLKWDIRHSNILVRKYMASVIDSDGRQLIKTVLQDYEARVLPYYESLPVQVIHNDANDYNLLVDQSTKTVSGLFDFGDMVSTFRIAELAIAAAYAIMEKDKPEEIIEILVKAYHRENPLVEDELDVLLEMIQMRLAVSLCISSFQYSESPENEYLLVSQKGAWQALKSLAEIDAVALVLKLRNFITVDRTISETSEQSIIDYRKQHLSENLSLAYQKPLKIVAGAGAYLYDESGSRYIDMVNNVCHVGHCHPQVVAAGQRQMAKLNTNTRYLHDNIIAFSQKLLATMPTELSVCMFVNSGSEANELALRLARTHTKRKAMVVVEGAYHGNANACIDISPYKFDGKGGEGAPDWVKQTIVPDPYRGKYRGRTEATGLEYGRDVKRVIDEFAERETEICGFICESIQGVGGQIIHPPGYLKSAYQFVRDAGGLCIADEVQVGMGRVGSHWWAFQTQGVIPDIITIGKPLGNGHPLAAVVTTKAIADSFVTGMEYFNTFGGNPVSCAIGSAVLDVVEKENLMSHAQIIGDYLVSGLIELQSKYKIIGDVRGLGMFIGAEFVLDRETLEPAMNQIDFVIERLKANGILLTTEGPFHNVLKIKPPLALSKTDAEYFLTKLDEILAEDGAKI